MTRVYFMFYSHQYKGRLDDKGLYMKINLHICTDKIILVIDIDQNKNERDSEIWDKSN